MRKAIVIGGGLAGLMGALALAEAGCRPLVLAKGQGTTHWTGGTLDLLGSNGTAPLRSALESLTAARPDHPYARVGIAGIDEAVGRFRGLMEAANYPYIGGIEQNMLLPSALGALRPTAAVPATMAAGIIQPDNSAAGELLIAGFRELRDFFPPLAAANLREQGIAARGAYLNVPPSHQRLDYTTRAFALLFEDATFREAIGQQLADMRGSATRIGLPAVLGLRDPLSVLADLEQRSGARIFEIPTLPPSVPGMRLMKLFHAAISAAGGRIQIGSEVLRGTGANGRLTHVYTEAAAREQEHRAEVFLLATGGIAGGGISTDYQGRVRETALNLPLQAPDSRGAWFASRFLHEAGHAIFRAGVPTDDQLRPLNEQQGVVYDNVVVAGAALAGSDPVQERSVTGMAVATGWRAGKLLAVRLTA